MSQIVKSAVKLVTIISIIVLTIIIMFFLSFFMFFSYRVYEINMDKKIDYANHKEFEEYIIDGVIVEPEIDYYSEGEYSIKVYVYGDYQKDITVSNIELYDAETNTLLSNTDPDKKIIIKPYMSDGDSFYFDCKEYDRIKISNRFTKKENTFILKLNAESADDIDGQTKEMVYNYKGNWCTYFDTP